VGATALILAASLGDPAGVGPELLAEAWTRRDETGPLPFFAVGGAGLLAAAARLRRLDVPIARIADPADAAEAFLEALPVFGDEDVPYDPGRPNRAGAALALASLRGAAQLADEGRVGGIVTGPVAKARLAEIGFAHPGQTEFVAEASGTAPDDAVMMIAGPNLRTVPLTIHVALSEVPRLITRGLVERKARIVAAALRRDFGLDRPRIAIAALNPHAGEDGRMGHEDRDVIAPAVAALQAEGLAVSGPHPADALFSPRGRAEFDVALCMYHDQALIPAKTLDFDAGVNVTLGLPIIRTSPDHGTAFAIAGRNLAHAGSTIAALRMAGECAARRQAA